MKIRNIIFDFDGTLMDTAPLIVATMHDTIKELGLPEITEEACRATIGLRLEDIPGVLFPEVAGLSKLYASTYRRIFTEKNREIIPVTYTGVVDTLKELHAEGYGLSVASSRSHRSLLEFTESLGITDIFSLLVGGDDVSKAKPDPEPVVMTCKDMRWDPRQTLVVGDTIFDIEMGAQAGAETCGVTYGNQSRAQLQSANPTYIIDSFPQLLEVLASSAS